MIVPAAFQWQPVLTVVAAAVLALESLTVLVAARGHDPPACAGTCSMRLAALVIGFSHLTLGCSKDERRAPPPPVELPPRATTSPGAASAARGPEPLSAESSVIDLPIEGHLPAVVALPVGVVDRRPVAVITHGMWGGPQWDCPMWRGVLGGYAFLLCLRGVPRADQPPAASPAGVAYTYASVEALDREMTAGLEALRARFGAFMDDGPGLYVGCSLGANYGVQLATRDPRRFPRLLLGEGGHDRWTPDSARRFAEGGGQRVLFACGQEGCFQAATAKARVLRAAGVEAQVAHAPRSGHVCHARVAEEARRALPWLVAGDARWSP